MGKSILFIMALFVAIVSITLVVLNKQPSFANNDSAKSVKKTVSMQKAARHKEVVPKVGLAVGNRAPNIMLDNLQGQIVNLAEYRGKKVLLNFWATWCPPCREEIPHLVQFYNKTDQDKMGVLAVNVTSMEEGGVEAVRTFAQKNGMSFPILLDNQEEAMATYGIVTIPTTFLLNEKGVIIAKHIGPVDEKWIRDQIK